MHKQYGFTIVEVIIIIVVIAILATLGGLVWRNAYNTARDNETKSNISMLKEAIEKYRSDNGEYPWPTSACAIYNTANMKICNGGELGALLIPRYIKQLPKDHDGRDYWYLVATDVALASSVVPTRYAIKVPLSDNTTCRTGRNMQNGWFGGVPECNF